jgi:hypothetical protein
MADADSQSLVVHSFCVKNHATIFLFVRRRVQRKTFAVYRR